MEIKRIQTDQLNYVLNNQAKDPVKQQKKTTDSAQISEEAKSIQSKKLASAELEDIKKKIDQNFYNSEEVINQTAERILAEISKSLEK